MESHEGLISKAPREIPDNEVSKKLDCGLLDVISRGFDFKSPSWDSWHWRLQKVGLWTFRWNLTRVCFQKPLVRFLTVASPKSWIVDFYKEAHEFYNSLPLVRFFSQDTLLRCAPSGISRVLRISGPSWDSWHHGVICNSKRKLTSFKSQSSNDPLGWGLFLGSSRDDIFHFYSHGRSLFWACISQGFTESHEGSLNLTRVHWISRGFEHLTSRNHLVRCQKN